MRTDHPWETRFARLVAALQWVALAVGIFVSFYQMGSTAASLGAGAAATVYVLVDRLVPLRWSRHPRLVEASVTLGIATTLTAVALTGGTNSPYLLLSLVPVLAAGALSGLRLGLEAALLSAALLAGVAWAQETVNHPQLIGLATLYCLIGVTFSYARDLFVQERARADALELVSLKATARLERLEGAHRLLTRLAELADDADLNLVSAGRAALEALDGAVDYRDATVLLSTDHGPLVVARRNGRPPARRRAAFSLMVGDREVGAVELGREEPFDDHERQTIEESLRPAALAFANFLLLSEIAQRAVREERARLARELHDEIGPSVASLGLALDLTALQEPTLSAMHLATLRESVTRLVEEIRTTVADLRQPTHGSLLEHVQALASEVPESGPKVVIDLEERRPPRPSMFGQLQALIAEAFRNALRHAEAETITIHGRIDQDRGHLSVRDDGRGFDRSLVASDRFGLIGMEERAAAIGARLQVSSSPELGTSVTLDWP